MELTIENAQRECAFWQAALRLQDWDVKLAIVRQGDLGGGTLGDCQPSSFKRQARIRLLDSRDLEGQGFWFDGECWDWEITLVHELLHLHLHDVVKDWSRPRGVAGERAIDPIAKALVRLRRSSAEDPNDVRPGRDEEGPSGHRPDQA